MSLFIFILIISFGMAASIATKKLTVIAALVGGMLSVFIYFGVGWPGIVCMAVFFLMGTLSTSWKKQVKASAGMAQERKGSRNKGQVLANGGAGGLLGIMAIFFPQQAPVFLLMMAAAFSSASADTVSSELGTVYGKNFYDVLSLKKGKRGADGIISLEGTLFGIMASVLIASIYGMMVEWKHFMLIVLAGTIGNLADSYLGGTLERRRMISNDVVNFLNTVIAALITWWLL